MDMAVANLFKHKIRFELADQGADIEEPTLFMTYRYYRSPDIENVKSLGINNFNDLFRVHCKPLVLYAISKIVHEDHIIPINYVIISMGVYDLEEYDDYDLMRYRFENPLNSPELFFTNSNIYYTSFPERLLNVRSHVFVHVSCHYYCESLREEVRFRRAFNYDRYWRYNFSIEEYVDGEEIEEYVDEEETEEAFLARHGVSRDGIGRRLLELREVFRPFIGRNINNNTILKSLPPPSETYRQEKCVICLEAPPSILYLDCMHIAVCDSCDRIKSKTSSQSTCDVCRAEISKRIKL